MTSSSPPPHRSNNNSNASSSLHQALLDGTSLDASERVCTVDELNVPTPTGNNRSEVRLKNLWHRATYIVVRHAPSATAEEEVVDQEEDEKQGHEDGGGEGKDTSATSKNKPLIAVTAEKKDTTTRTTTGDEHENEEYILVQRRSNLKDYHPNKLDPAPGGVVGYGESYQENAERELAEEMGIDVCTTSGSSRSSATSGATMKRLFTFPYSDDRCRCWGELYEVTYNGPLNALRLQQEEVSEVLRLPLSDVKVRMEQRPDEWIPDGRHALQLYLQHRHDRRLNRRLLKGYSSGNLDAYALRPKPSVVFFDCDDCLYFDGWKTADQLTAKIDSWCTSRGLPSGEAYQLYKRHGTALRGLLAEGHMDQCEKAIDAYLKEVHDLPIDALLKRDEELRHMLQKMDPSIPKYIFTASVREHAERCLKALGIRDLFVDIIDVKACNLATKHSKEAFDIAMRIANVTDPERCVFLDDSVTNIRAARQVGWRSILVGKVGRDCGQRITADDAEHEIERIHELPTIFPELFGGGGGREV